MIFGNGTIGTKQMGDTYTNARKMFLRTTILQIISLTYRRGFIDWQKLIGKENNLILYTYMYYSILLIKLE